MIARLPDYYLPPAVPPPYVPPMSSLSRPTASSINRSSPAQEFVLTMAGFGRPVPVLYGEQRVPGRWLVRPYVINVASVDRLRFALLWSWGEIEGVQAVFLNGQTVSSGHMTHYLGTGGQPPDPLLAANIPGFNDAYPNWAYTVFDIPAGAYDGFPQTVQIGAVVRGIKVLDPRTSTVAWSENPALCARDWVASELYGPALPVYGTEACADRCDELVGGVEVRCRFGIVMEEPQSLGTVMDLLSAYGEFLWVHDDDGLLLVPDAPVDEMAAVLTLDDIIEGTLRLTGAPLDSVPTEVIGTYRQSSGGADPWPESSEVARLAGVDTGVVAAVRSEVHMPGIRRGSEMGRKVLMRLRRLQHPGRYAWQAFDDGIKFQRGDVIQLPDTRGMEARQVRVLSNDLVAYGRHQITAEHYSPDMYPDEYLPGETTTVPIGGILPYIGAGTPSGYEDFAEANGRFLVGAGDSFARGDTFGATTYTISGETSSVPNHSFGSGQFWTTAWPLVQGSLQAEDSVNLAAGGHFHNYSVAQDRTPQYTQIKLIRKTGAPGDVPVNAGVYADGVLIAAAYEALSVQLGRLNRAGSTLAQGGSSLTYNLNVGIQPAGAHHHAGNLQFPRAFNVDFPPPSGFHDFPTGAPAHVHGSSIPVTLSIPRVRLAHYVASGTAEIVPGAIIGFHGDGALPPGWYDADGNNGTQYTTDLWIERSAPGSAGSVVAGTRQAVWSGAVLPGGRHRHDTRPVISEYRTTRLASHTDGEEHTHTASGAVPYDPPSYAMRFIQYTGVI